MDMDSTADFLQTPFVQPFIIGGDRERLQAQNFDRGGEGIAYRDSNLLNSGGDFRKQESVDIQRTSDVNGSYNIESFRGGEWLEYTTDVVEGTYDIKFRIAPQKAISGSLEIELEDELLGKITATGTDQNWQTVSLANVRLSGGEDKILRLSANDGGSLDLNWIEFYQRPIDSDRVRSTDDFIDSIGVTAAIGFDETSYSQFDEVVKPKLKELGVNHLRTNAVSKNKKTIGKLEELAELGIEFNFIMDPRRLSPSESVELVEKFGNSVESIEGPNEWNHNLKKKYKGKPFPIGLRNYQSDLYQAFKQDPDTANIPIIAPSLSNASGIESAVKKLGIVDADINNAHNYPGGKLPVNGKFFAQLPYYFKVGGAEKPLISTETGYTNAFKWSKSVSEEAASKYLPRLLLTHFNYGFERTYLYELMDDHPNPASDNKEYHFGLLRADGSEKKGFKTIKNTIAILDNSDVAANSKSVTLGSLDYELKGDLTNIHQTLLQKQDGRFYLILWQAVPSYDLKTKSNIEVDSKPLTVDFGDRIEKAAIYRPHQGIEPRKTKQNINSTTVNIDDSVMIMEITPFT